MCTPHVPVRGSRNVPARMQRARRGDQSARCHRPGVYIEDVASGPIESGTKWPPPLLAMRADEFDHLSAADKQLRCLGPPPSAARASKAQGEPEPSWRGEGQGSCSRRRLWHLGGRKSWMRVTADGLRLGSRSAPLPRTPASLAQRANVVPHCGSGSGTKEPSRSPRRRARVPAVPTQLIVVERVRAQILRPDGTGPIFQRWREPMGGSITWSRLQGRLAMTSHSCS
jgi:hypothetical protein